MITKFQEIGPNSRIWIFQSSEYLQFEKMERLSARMMNFLDGWQAHGKDLNTAFEIRYHRFLIVALDEASYQATGCSIDKLVQHIQSLENELTINLLDRMQIAYRDENGMIDTMHLTAFRAALENGELDESTVVFNNLIERKGQLESEWEVALRESWQRKWLPVA